MKAPTSSLLKQAMPGQCRYCRCTQMRACDEGCAWFDREGTVCDNPDCVKRFATALAKAGQSLRFQLRKRGVCG